jgi:hypothetical protein
MRILRSAPTPHFPEPDDFNFADADELLTLPALVCPTPHEREACGCGRCFDGVASVKGTTYGLVAGADALDVEAEFANSEFLASWSSKTSTEEALRIFWPDMLSLSAALDGIPVGEEIKVANRPDRFLILREDGSTREGIRPAELRPFVLRAIPDNAGR